MANEGVKLGKSTAQRVINSTRYVEQIHRNVAPQPSPPVTWGGAQVLIVTTALNPMSGNAPGQNGQGKIQTLVSTTYSDLSSTVYTIVNDTTSTVAVGAYVLCVPGPGGKFHMVTVDKCSNLS